jgi:hypothetical protein
VLLGVGQLREVEGLAAGAAVAVVAVRQRQRHVLQGVPELSLASEEPRAEAATRLLEAFSRARRPAGRARDLLVVEQGEVLAAERLEDHGAWVSKRKEFTIACAVSRLEQKRRRRRRRLADMQ